MTSRSSSGFTIAELAVVLVLLALVVASAMAGWQTYRRSAEVQTAARQLKMSIYRARMLSVYRGTTHFVVLDPGARRLEVYRDSSAPFGVFDNGDARISQEPLPRSAKLSLPAEPASIPNPLGGSALTDAWALPDPDTSAAWGTTKLGVVTTPTGLIRTAEATPQTVNNGVIVFSDMRNRTASVGIRGQSGTVSSFRLVDSAWKKL